MLPAQFIYALFCIWFAYINFLLIKYEFRIYHGVNGLIHVLFWMGTIYCTKCWELIIVLPFVGRIVFDAALNMMRGLPIDYLPRKPKSIVDKIEKFVFQNDGLLAKIIYLTFVILVNISFVWLISK